MKILKSEIMEKTQGLLGVLNKPLPAKTAYWFGRFLKQLRTEWQKANEEREKICRQYARKDEYGKPVIINDTICGTCGVPVDNNAMSCPRCNAINPRPNRRYDILDKAACSQALQEALSGEIEIDFNPIPLDEKYFGDMKFLPEEMMVLDEFVVVPEDEEGDGGQDTLQLFSTKRRLERVER